MNKHLIILFYAIIIASGPALAEIKLPAFFAGNMVLQQQAVVKIWGTAAVHERVSVKGSWDGKKYKVTADDLGHWSVKVSTPAAGGPFEVEVSGSNKIILTNVLIGEVWLCSGQSNMDMPVKGYGNSPVLNSNEILVNAPNHRIRLFHVSRKTSASPLDDVTGTWEEADVSSVAAFSAVGYLFSSILNKHLDIPIGMIQSTWGGSPIEAWTDTMTLANVSKDNHLTGGATTKQPHQTPSYLFNGMIAPLVGYGIAGVLWYQGEQNRYNYNDYYQLQPAMVKAWRDLWGFGNWPFYYAQIAPMRYPSTQKELVPHFREVQLQLAAKMQNAGMAVTIDAGDENNIHPAKKELVAKRLAWLALSKTYYKTAISCVGPLYQSIKISKDTLTVLFSNAPLGMTTFGNAITQFEIAGQDRVFYKASARLNGATVVLRGDSVKNPVAARYAFTDWAAGELYGTDGLPVSSFRTDDW